MATKNTWYAVTNKTSDSADVEIYDEIGGWGVSASEFIKGLKDLEGKHINLRINSPGGSIIDGQAIIAALSRHAAGFTAWVDGLAASMASVIACAAGKCFMAEGSMMMIHRASTVSIGDAETLRKDATLLEKFEKGLLNIYAKKTGMDQAELETMLAEETWLNALEAVALGFADGITDGTPATAKLSEADHRARFDNFRNGMEANPANPETVEEVIPVVEVTEAAPVEPVVEEVIESAEEPEVSELPAPNASADVKALAAQISALNARALAAEARAEKAEADVRHISSLLETLEASKGIIAASVVPPVSPVATSSDPVAAYKAAIEAGDKKAASEIFAKHKAELYKAAKTIS